VIKTTIIQHAPYYVSLGTISSVIIRVIVKVKRCVSRAGAARHVINQSVRKDVCTAIARVQVSVSRRPQVRANYHHPPLSLSLPQVYANVGTVMKARAATNASRILDAKMASARGHGNVFVLQIGVGSCAIMVSTSTSTLFDLCNDFSKKRNNLCMIRVACVAVAI
jgi:hypothetical protein